ncbi:MAG: hypothetical protein AAF495_26455 [Pseudomonadota bacterium]
MRQIGWWRRGLSVMLALGMIAATAAPAAAQNPRKVRQAADPLAFNLNDGILGPALVGGGLLDRNRRTVRATISVTGLSQLSAPYTAWWVVFNNPEACTGGAACGPSDLLNAAADVVVFHATGFFSDANGAANFTARLVSGQLPEGTDVFLNGEDGIGLRKRNGLGAEIHVVVRGHGPAPVPNDGAAGFTTADQISLFNGGCVGAVGDPPDACEDEQVFIFPAP